MGIKFEFTGNVTFDECSKEEYIAQMDTKLKMPVYLITLNITTKLLELKKVKMDFSQSFSQLMV